MLLIFCTSPSSTPAFAHRFDLPDVSRFLSPTQRCGTHARSMADPYIFAQVTSTDRAGVVWVAAILSLLYSLSTLVARFFVKFHTLGYDDWLILAASVVAFAQYIAVFVSLHQGLGISSLIQAKDVAESLGSGVLANEILFIVAIALTKLSVVFFVKRLLTHELRTAWWATHIVLGLTLAWAVASILLVSVGCSPQHAVYEPETCSGMVSVHRL